MQSLKKDIKEGHLKQVYVLSGEEKYLVRYYKKQLIRLLTDDKMPINLSHFDAEYNIIDVKDIINSYPFMADKRLIVFDSINVCSPANLELVELLKNLPDYCYVVLIENNLDKRTKNYKILNSLNAIVEFPYQNHVALKKWINAQVAAAKMQIDDVSSERILTMVGESMDSLDSELKKIIGFCLEKGEIGLADVELLCIPNIQNKIFQMINATIKGKLKDSFLMYRDMLLLKEAPTKVLILMNRQYLQLYHIKEQKTAGISISDVAKNLKMNYYVLKNEYWRLIDDLSNEFLLNKINKGCILEQQLKQGKIGENLAVELMIVG